MNRSFSFRHQGQRFSIRVSSFNGRISLGMDGWLVGEFWSVDRVVRNCEEQARYQSGSRRARKMDRRTVELIEDFVRLHENAWLGS